MKKAFLYVGHSHWGKSYALRIITGGNPYSKLVQINGHLVRVRKMSNDDKENALLIFVNHIPNSQYDRFILTYCPTHDTEPGAMQILNSLSGSCKLFFFVQESRFSDPSERVTAAEIAHLNRIGTVNILRGNHTDTVRAARFLQFIRRHI